MDMNEFSLWVDARVNQLQRLAGSEALPRACALLARVLARGGKVLVFGNGGSASQASHLAAELVNRFGFDRPALPALALTVDPAVLTSIANDDRFERVFARQVEALGRPGDLAIGLTTSGRSPNVLLALRRARELELDTLALCGEHDGDLLALGLDEVLAIPSTQTPVVQEMHLLILHRFAAVVEETLYGGKR
jgi:D-sedoheptulose 7-phosphate isomerase